MASSSALKGKLAKGEVRSLLSVNSDGGPAQTTGECFPCCGAKRFQNDVAYESIAENEINSSHGTMGGGPETTESHFLSRRPPLIAIQVLDI